MDQAWLDSLSEDWISQPRSSGSPPPSLPSLNSSTSNMSRVPSSSIPKYDPQQKSWMSGKDSTKALGERSPSDNNISASQRGAIRRPSKLRDEITNNTRGRQISRSVSASSAVSAPYDTIQHNQSISVSPSKGPKETPEWKRRLLHGDVAYGEQRDLFAPAGLESIFAPPTSHTPVPTKPSSRSVEEGSMCMPSSPPPYSGGHEQTESPTQHQQSGAVLQNSRNQQQPRAMRYKLADVAESDFSVNDLSHSSSFRPGMVVPRKDDQTQDVFSDTSTFDSSAAPHNVIMDGVVRMVSGQSDVRNEELSPIYIARHNTVDGGINYAALNLPPEELQQRLENLPIKSDAEDGDNLQDMSRCSPDEITAKSADFPDLGSFVNVRRGGLSHEGSFHRRLLSPSSPAIDESALLPETSLQASTPKELPSLNKSRPSNNQYESSRTQSQRSLPKTPHPSPTKSEEKASKGSSGSPLKLFGTHDTFTNQTLLRRLSQFEDHFDDDTKEDLPSATGQESTRPEINEGFVAASGPEKAPRRDGVRRPKSRKFSSFGEGELDDFQFSEETSYESNRSNAEGEDKENITLPTIDPNTQTRFRFQLEPSPALDGEVITERRTKYMNTTSSTKQTVTVAKTRSVTGTSEDIPAVPSSKRLEDLETPRKRIGDSEGKRLPKSPLKDPTPKRRRTLQKTDLEEDVARDEHVDLDSLRETHQQMQSVIGKKRKDARHGDDQQAANPKVLAMRQILRPRTPTPSQRSSQQHERAPLYELDLSSLEQERLQREKIARIQAELDSTDTLKLSNALALSQQMQNESRKGSVTTQDFLDEAKKIMAGIRGKARPRSGLNSVEESELENDRNKLSEEFTPEEELEESYQESTQEPFSRPPSREGPAIPRLPVRQQDPEVLDHLRKYEEISDMDGLIASSIKSIAMARDAADSAREIDRRAKETISRVSGRSVSHGSVIESEPPKIRILENPEMQRKRKHSSSSSHNNDGDHVDGKFSSQGSNSSSGQSTTRSIPTGSSRGSDSRRVIPPEAVAHLLSEQVAGMFLDRERNIWVKNKTPGELATTHSVSPSDDTEDDPFGDIPDLSVDETQELRRIKAVAAKRKTDMQNAEVQYIENRREGILPAQMFSKSPYRAYLNPEPEPSSEPSRLTRFTSSVTVAETNTRATSWGDELLPTARSQGMLQSVKNIHLSLKSKTTTQLREEIVDDVEREISINEDRVKHSTPRQRRNITISFSSPLASIIQPSPYKDEKSFDHRASENSQSENEEDDGFGDDSVVIHKRGSDQKTNSMKSRSTFRNTSSRLSVGGHMFSARPVSRIDERDEEYLNGEENDHNRRSIGIVVATPIPSRRASSVVIATPRPAHEIGTLSLTPMSDFTVHHADESYGLEVSYIAPRYVSGSNGKRTLSLSIKELVEKITEVEPYEPFWEHIKQMELRDKQLTNLHKLDEFCKQLEDLDISNNQISQLNGAPRSLRHLRITHNHLSDLTAWSHLSNLQYIDLSNNGLESLSALKSLVHLRGLKADNNKIKSLHGISNLDGLLSLRLRGNLVDLLDFTGSSLQRLTDLDLRNNRVHEVKNLHELQCLSSLDLENNNLSILTIEASEQLQNLKHLKLSGNNLEYIDVSQCPDLRLLYLDRNRLGTVAGLLKTKHLDSLSLREQQDGAVINSAFLNEAFEVRKLFLSGNLLHTFKPRFDFLNLQYLELANCGLESLPIELGQMICNTRVLNLNFNALKDIKSLLGIVRLKKLYLAGNRLSRLRKTTSILGQFPTLTLADLRSNPLTQGFYSPVIENRLIKREGVDAEEGDISELFTLGMADREKDDRYAGRLDMDTKMVRRVYEILVLSGCPRLKTLDGLAVDRSILSANDKVWEALLDAGIVEGTPGEQGEQGKGESGEKEIIQELETPPKPEKSAVWPAEDSFA